MTLLESRLAVIAVCAWLLVLASCSIIPPPQPERTQFFVLTSMVDVHETGIAPAAAHGTSNLAIGIGPVELPDYLRRPELVTRTGPTTVELSEVNRWAEPLDSAFARVLSEDLSRLLGTQRMVTYPWYRPTKLDYQVQCNVIRFETDSNGGSELHAQWSIRDGRDGRLLIAKDSDITGPRAPDDKSPSAGLSRDLGVLSQQIASQLSELNEERGKRTIDSAAEQ